MIAPPNDAIPADVVLEKQVLAIAMTGETALVDLARIVRPEHFYRLEHGEMFAGLLGMLREAKPIEIAAIAAEFRNSGLMTRISPDGTDSGGAEYLGELGDYAFLSSNLEYYARQLRAKATLRSLLLLGNDISTSAKAPNADPQGLAEQYQQRLCELARPDNDHADVVTAGAAVDEAIARADRIAAGQESPGLMTGFQGIDDAVGGFQAGDLITVGAGTSVGKSSFAQTVAARVADDGGAVLIVSAEMPRMSIGGRLLQIVSGVSGGRLRTGNLNECEIESRAKARERIAKWRLGIYDHPATVAEIAARSRVLATQWGGLSLIVVDYLQLLRPSGGDTRAQEVSQVAWGLKQLAMLLACPVLMLSQLNRAGVRQADDERPPSLHDLKESGDVENHSNTVLLLHRSNRAMPDTAGAVPIWCKVAKARDGAITPWPAPAGKPEITGSITLRFRPELTRFE